MLAKTTLHGRTIRLEPLAAHHLPGLAVAIKDGALDELPVTLVPGPHELDKFLENADLQYSTGFGLSFATIEQASGTVVGSTWFRAAKLAHRRVEIGFTFIAQSWQRTAVNTEATYLMLKHAFELWQFKRVEFLTDCLNAPSRAAIARIGATQEGTLRSHMVMRDAAAFEIQCCSASLPPTGLRSNRSWRRGSMRPEQGTAPQVCVLPTTEPLPGPLDAMDAIVSLAPGGDCSRAGRRSFLAQSLAAVGLLSLGPAASFATESVLVINVTGLYAVPVARIEVPCSSEEVAALICTWPGQIAIGGGRYSMGGQVAIRARARLADGACRRRRRRGEPDRATGTLSRRHRWLWRACSHQGSGARSC